MKRMYASEMSCSQWRRSDKRGLPLVDHRRQLASDPAAGRTFSSMRSRIQDVKVGEGIESLSVSKKGASMHWKTETVIGECK